MTAYEPPAVVRSSERTERFLVTLHLLQPTCGSNGAAVGGWALLLGELLLTLGDGATAGSEDAQEARERGALRWTSGSWVPAFRLILTGL